jgi:hypothetical protein
MGDRHVDAQLRCQAGDLARRADALGDMSEVTQYLRQGLAGTQSQTDAAIARQVAGTGDRHRELPPSRG